MSEQKNILLLHPTRGEGLAGYASAEVTHMPPLSLSYVAAATPSDWNVRIVDEYIETVTGTEKADIVGMTVYSANVCRAYELAHKFKENGAVVVMGGIHASLNPDEILRYADSVVVGEAESIWPNLLSDFKEGVLKRKYISEKPDMSKLPIPRRDLLSSKYSMDVMQTSRGCPFTCEFCSVSEVYGAKYRQRPVDLVVDEFTSLEKDIVYFVDDNIIGASAEDHERAKAIFDAIVDSGSRKIWFSQASINIADNEDLLNSAYKSGCRLLYVGLESIDVSNLKQMRKMVNVKGGSEGIANRIRKIHSAGIGVIGSFIVGQDYDTCSTFDAMLDFMDDCSLDVLDLSYMAAYRGTKLYNRLSSENRLIYSDYPEDWHLYDGDNLVVKPKQISIVELVHGFDKIIRRRFSKRHILAQLFKTWRTTQSIEAALLAYNFNKGQRASYLARM